MRPAALAFVQDGCGACSEFEPRFKRAVAGLGAPAYVINLSAGGRATALADQFKVRATPTTIVMGPRGVVRSEGAITDAQLRRQLGAVR